MNCDSFTFNSFILTTSNYFSPLSETMDSIVSDSPFSPTKTSSPKTLAISSRCHSPKSSRSSRPSTNRAHSSTHSSSPFPQKSNLRVMTVNCRSIMDKQSEFKAVLDYVKPDIVCGTESWLRGISPGQPSSQDHVKSS